MDAELSKAIVVVQEKMESLNAEQRLRVLEIITKGYCSHCGYPIPSGEFCFCEAYD